MAKLDVVTNGKLTSTLPLSIADGSELVKVSPDQSIVVSVNASTPVYLVEDGDNLLLFASQTAERPFLTLQDFFQFNDSSQLFINDGGNLLLLSGGQLVDAAPEISHELAATISPDGQDNQDGVAVYQEDYGPDIWPFIILGGSAAGAVLISAQENDSNNAYWRTTFSGNTTADIDEDSSSGVISGDITASNGDGMVGVKDTQVAGKYGTFELTNGKWTYKLDSAKAQALGDGESYKEMFTVEADNGTTQKIVITVTGEDDAAVIEGDVTGDVVENGTNTASGQITVTDADSKDHPTLVKLSQDGKYGLFVLGDDGHWTYTLDNSNPATQALDAGEKAEDKFTVQASDGTTKEIVITVEGADSAPVPPVSTVPGTSGSTATLAYSEVRNVTGSDADDTFTLSDSVYQLNGHFDGGNGFDRLVLNEGGTIDLAAVANKIEHVEQIDLTNDKQDNFSIRDVETLHEVNDQLVGQDINVDEVFATTSGQIDDSSPLSHLLHISGDEGDKLKLVDAENWQKSDITHAPEIHADAASAQDAPAAAHGNFTLYQYTGENGAHEYVFVENNIIVI